MGIDSGLPDFRGPEGFWRAYPALGLQRLMFEEIACPDAFVRDPEQAWGFYAHRLNLYRRTTPHAGFALLRAMAERLERGAFVFTSNVDGQFQKAGFDELQVAECHGSLHHLQCFHDCRGHIWPAADFAPEVDEARCRAALAPAAAAPTAAPWPGPTCSCSATGTGSPAAPKYNASAWKTGWPRCNARW